MAMTDTGLVARLLLAEPAASTPATVPDSGPSAGALDAVYDGTKMSFYGTSPNRGVRFTSTTGDQRLERTMLAGDPLRTALQGSKVATIELRSSLTDGSSSGSRIFGVNGTAGENGALIVKANNDTHLYLSFNNTNHTSAAANIGGSGIRTIHFIVNTDEAVQNDRVKVSIDGAAPVGQTNSIALGSTINIDSAAKLIVGNRESGGSYSRSAAFDLQWAAIYSVVFDAARVADHHAALVLDDDTAPTAADTTPPVISSPTATPTSATLTNAGFTTNEANGTSYAYVSGNASESAATIKASGASLATPGAVVSFTGLAWSAGQYVHLVQDDSASPTPNTSNVLSLLIADATGPTATGPLTVTVLSSTSYSIGGFSAVDNLAVTGWRWRVDAGIWNTFTGTSFDVTGRTNAATDAIEVQARDAAENWSNTLSKSVVVGSTTKTAHALSFPTNNGTNSATALNLDGLSRTNHTFIWKSKRRMQTGYYGEAWHVSRGAGPWSIDISYAFGTHPYPTQTGTYDVYGERDDGGSGPIHYSEIAGLRNSGSTGRDYISSPVSIVGAGNQASYPVDLTHTVWITGMRQSFVRPDGVTLRHHYYPDLENHPDWVIIQDIDLDSVDDDVATANDRGFTFGAPVWRDSGDANDETPYGEHRYFKAFNGVLSVAEGLAEAASESDSPVSATGIATQHFSQIDPTVATIATTPGNALYWRTAYRPADWSEEIQVVAASGASQSLAFTLDDIAASVAQNLSHSQALAAALDGISASIAQNLRHSQALAASLDGVSVSIAQSKTGNKSQSVAFALDDVSASVSQTLSRVQSLSITLDGIQADITQGVNGALSQSLAITLDGVAVAVAQNLQHAQSLALSLDGVSVSLAQSVSSPVKTQALAVTLDDVSIEIAQIGAEPETGGRGFVIVDTPSKLWWKRKPKALPEEDADEKVQRVVRVIERVAKKQVQAEQPAKFTQQKAEVRQAIAPMVEQMPGFDWMAVYVTILDGLKQQEAQRIANAEIERIRLIESEDEDLLILMMGM
jgi:hypothetical protein